MRLNHGLHLAYCTNVHRGGAWSEVLASLERHTLAVKRIVSPDRAYAIGLRLGDKASRELSDPRVLEEFRDWLKRHDCYVFTINGFPQGEFHGVRVKEKVCQPDWSTPERRDYTKRLFEILARLLPEGGEGSVSTVPVSFKQFRLGERGMAAARGHLWDCIEHMEALCRERGLQLHLGLEPEPFGTVENSPEMFAFMEEMAADRPGDLRLKEHLGVNYDTCHFALQYERPDEALEKFRRKGVRVSKLHLSNALRVHPTADVRARLAEFIDNVYFHQVIERRADGELVRYADLDEALATSGPEPQFAAEWRVHFHIPLHTPEYGELGSTASHLTGALDVLRRRPDLCRHLEMETYTWEVLPKSLKTSSVVEMLAAEYRWTLAELADRGFHPI
jgi:sugar phosphate isomerase/epimerase